MQYFPGKCLNVKNCQTEWYKERFLCKCEGELVLGDDNFDIILGSGAKVEKLTAGECGPGSSPVGVVLMGHTLALYSTPGSKSSKVHFGSDVLQTYERNAEL